MIEKDIPKELVKKDFLEKFRILGSDFNKSKLKWKDLQFIYSEYTREIHDYESVAKFVNDQLLKFDGVHSVSYRIKHPEHLIEKIIRKKIQDPKRSITKTNYKTSITDLIGLRILHLYKFDWLFIHRQIKEKWNLNEDPVANVRQGDSLEQYESENCAINEHARGYRSVHYLAKTKPSKDELIVEIQVRTIFEEAWSEIDHDLNYPYSYSDPMINKYLTIFNRLAGSADEIGTHIKELNTYLLEKQLKLEEERVAYNQKLENLETKIADLKIDKANRDELISDLKEAQEKRRNYIGIPEIDISKLPVFKIPDKAQYTQSIMEGLESVKALNQNLSQLGKPFSFQGDDI